jgi:hypothetical protein
LPLPLQQLEKVLILQRSVDLVMETNHDSVLAAQTWYQVLAGVAYLHRRAVVVDEYHCDGARACSFRARLEDFEVQIVL